MVGSVNGWQTRLRNAVSDSESFYLMHCGTHQLNLVNGKAIAAIGHEGSDWLEKLYAVVKWLRKQASFIESLGSQSPYHIEVRWTSLEVVLGWWRNNQDEVTAHCLVEDKEIADDVEWWLVLIIVHEHFKAIGGAMRALQGRELLVEGQLEKLEQLRGQLAEMHCITRRSGLDADSHANSECDEASLSDDVEGERITYQGSALTTVAACGPWQARLQDIWDGVSKHGLDAWDLHETIVDVEDEGSS
jgi:type IV secretory pathway TrbD component